LPLKRGCRIFFIPSTGDDPETLPKSMNIKPLPVSQTRALAMAAHA